MKYNSELGHKDQERAIIKYINKIMIRYPEQSKSFCSWESSLLLRYNKNNRKNNFKKDFILVP
jgi:hypothetical protein